MQSFERPINNSAETFTYNPTDYEDESFYPLLQKLPPELAKRCITIIENQEMNEQEASAYIEQIIIQRKEAVTESYVSNPDFESYIKGTEEAFYAQIETEIFTSTENHLGSGMTARIKGCTLTKTESDETLDVAVKYVVTPTEKTLSASGEHDVLAEVERVKEIEKREMQHKNRSKYIRVPHPYFHHKTDKMQCYGMEQIHGANLQEIIDETTRPMILGTLKQSPLLTMDIDELFEYIDKFFNTMHTYCLHGDIKPANIMLSTEGVLFVIDFGQSILTNDITEKTTDQFENLKEDEIKIAKQSIRRALNVLRDT